MLLTSSPIEQVSFYNRLFYIKRDDLLHESFSGNKARKFYSFLKGDFSGCHKLISYGSAQANSLFSFSELAKLKGWQFDFYVSHIASFMKQNPKGNYRAALENGANIIEVGDLMPGELLESYVKNTIIPNEKNHLFVPEGGRCQYARMGIDLLAQEIICWAENENITQLKIALPAGTGTTALFLQQYFKQQKYDFEVLTCACIGGDEYLKQQFLELCLDETQHPKILSSSKKYHFGKLYKAFFEIWQKLKLETNIEFELLYDPLGWLTLLEHLEREQIERDRPVLYIHQGGLLGNETMLPRYRRKYHAKLT
ncbi:1-aminocyclopropane-1-carboxylate deaminase [Pseudoalteromonas denitrificans]|uniref:1-aminocyclopropane-1-carboxylate deaminase n=1 Tax=Pseudoalteromonas denitrificans DSM 6059 TaxID=1123010 RepID=A0A1I1R134_9GAMM|nr:1-aminocyclopropane-1-carboxylate deaminase [Pseudoalteromonas denitrificans]SFD25838.1 1-aminocyclopropane-1-carboxylate deaminase [Pseudoalteromonas denitrificans DSM 6059]